MADIEEIARTVALYAVPGMKPKDLVAKVRERHPGASKKEISRGAFFAVILAAEADPHKASALHDLAIASRVGVALH
ncbi:hypothetical protein [Aureimonas leprariae]|uniref:Uncharacterized protein n=1 Tax=Plantimonas leprariae TaxID=2615207 RepID=A0A7V7PKS3_9HYPH|nr:hypothetical protein [Aureimonas leprariae]KAB0676286.1 hypothetical protein F6X38_21510 [Aureimonas leprariae]